MKITIGINSLTSIQHSAYGNHLQVFFNLGRRYTDINFIFVNPPRMSIDRMRNLAADVALKSESDYLMFIDDDILLPLNDGVTFLRKLLALNADIAAGDAIIRSYPFEHMVFTYENDDKKTLKPLSKLPSQEPFIVNGAVGFSCCLIKTEVLKFLPKPYFVTTPNHSTEDVYFCLKARDHVENLKIMCDPRITCGHILWEEVMSEMNIENYKTYYEAQYLNEKPEAVKYDRGTNYYTEVKKTLET